MHFGHIILLLKTSLGMSPYQFLYGKPCYLLVELEHKSFWGIKAFNSNLDNAGNVRNLQLNYLDELRNDGCENFKIIKERTNFFMIKEFFEKHLRLVKKCYFIILVFICFQEKLKTKWSGPIVVKNKYPYRAIKIENPKDGVTFKVNVQKLKGIYHFTTKVLLTYHVSTKVCRKVYFTIKVLRRNQFTTIPLRKS